LKIIEQSGSVKYSQVVKMVNQTEAKFQLRPSAVTSSTNLHFQLAQKKELNINLYNAAGHLQWSQLMEIPGGNSFKTLDMSGLAKGIYFIRINEKGKENSTLSFVKI
jgi:hypothetical protein